MEPGRFRPVFWGSEGLHRSWVSFHVPGWRILPFVLPFTFRFFETTGLAALTTLIQHYKVEPHPKFAGEPRERLKEIYSQATSTLSLK